jgi:FAD:protein FMN transferase
VRRLFVKRALLPCLVFLLLNACSQYNTYKFHREIMEIPFSITVVEEDKVPLKYIEDTVEQSFLDAERVYGMFNNKTPTAETARINMELASGRRGERADIKVSQEFYDLFVLILSLSEKTNGAFDLSFKVVSELWERTLRGAIPRLPTQSEINEAMLYSGRNSFELKGNNVIRFKKGVKIGFGGVIKGYMQEKMSEVLKKRGVRNYIIEARGDISVSGNKFGKPWSVALLNPSDEKKNFGYCLSGGKPVSIFTSGNFYGFIGFNGKKYSDIMDMRTGRPSDSDLLSITVIAKDPRIADAYATAYYVYGFARVEQQFEVFDKEGIGVIIIDNKNSRKMNATAMKYCYMRG